MTSFFGVDIKSLNPLNKSVTGKQLAIGAAVGVVATALTDKYVWGKIKDKMPDMIKQNPEAMRLVLGGIAAAGAYFAAKKFKPAYANAVLVGTVALAAMPLIQSLVGNLPIPGLSDYVSIPYAGMNSYITDVPRINGMNSYIANVPSVNGYGGDSSADQNEDMHLDDYVSVNY